jgi:hypothetical protein
MRKIMVLLAVLPLLLNATTGYSQTEIISVVPSSGFQGQEMDVLIRGKNTHFKNGVSTIDFGQGITVQNFNVTTIESGVARIKIDVSAAISPRNVTVNTAGEIATADGMFDVFELGGKITAALQIVPAQTIYIADFDVSDPSKIPVLFNILIYNDNKARTLFLKLNVSGEQSGDIASATKTLSGVQPNGIVQVNNKEFDKYIISANGNAFVDKTLKTGILPPDLYSYELEVYDENNVLVAEAEGKNLITNTVNRPELILPGNAFNLIPEVIQGKFPVFQWFAQDAKSFDFYLYPVFDNQTTAEEVSQNRTVFEQKGLTSGTFPYPLSAEILQEGKTYAWQVKSNVSGSRGDITLSSEVFWFKVMPAGGPGATKITPLQINQIKINPDELTIGIGEKIQFRALAYDFKGDTVNIKPEWKVIPSDFGSVDEDGVFTAGNRPGMTAVLISYAGQQDYCTITIKWKEEYIQSAFGFEGFLNRVFGLPKQ